MDLDPKKVFASVSAHGVLDYGAAIRLDLRFADGSIEPIRIPHERLGHLAAAMEAAASLAADQRKKTGQTDAPGDALRVDEIIGFRAGVLETRNIIGQFQTKHGFSHNFTFTMDQAKFVIDRLKAALTDLKSGRVPKLHS